MDEARAELKAYKRKAKAQRDNWKARAVKAESLLSGMVSHFKIEKCGRADAPGHCHMVAGTWDCDGSPCEWCKTWAEVVKLVEGK
jgi:uncharacterized cupin superfamily protein